MKKFLVIFMFVALVFAASQAIAVADENDDTLKAGVGTDIVLYEGKYGDVLNKVTVEYKYNWEQTEHSVFTVATFKLVDLVNFVNK